MKYAYTDHIVMRVPRFPENYIRMALADGDFFESVIASDDFKAAVYLASPSLSAEHEKYLAGRLAAKECARLKNTLLKYLGRMSTRCTPFASFAACAAVEVGNDDNIVLSQEVKTCSRPDMLYLCSLSQLLQVKMRRNLRYRANSTIYRVGGSVRCVSCRYLPNGRSYSIEQVKNTELLAFVLKLCQNGYVGYGEIVKSVIGNYDAGEKEIEHYVDDLIDNQLIVGEIEPFVTGDDYLSFLQANVGAEFKADIDAIANAVAAIDKDGNVATYAKCYEEIASMLGKYGIKCDKKYVVQTDSFRPLKHGIVSKQITDQLGECMTLMAKITPRHEVANIVDFCRRFEQRYEAREVGLLEALDPDVGIGYIVNNDRIPNPLIAGLRLPQAQQRQMGQLSLTPIVKILLQKIMDFNAETNKAIELTDDDVRGLGADFGDLPLSMAAFFRVVGKNADGTYRLADVHFSGASAANMLSRFAYENSIKPIVRTIASREQAAVSDVIVAEIAHISESRTGNILFRPHIRDYEITYLTGSTLDDEHVIPASDLMVSVKGRKVMLRSRRLQKEIIPRLTSAHNYKGNTTPLYRFLCDLQSQSGRASLYFSWGGLEAVYDYLPRVVYKQNIMSPARWTLAKEKFLSKEAASVDMDKVRSWRTAKRLPREVNLVVGDNKLYLDLECATSVGLLVGEVPKLGKFVLEEYLPCMGYVVDERGNSYANEFIMPYVKVP